MVVALDAPPRVTVAPEPPAAGLIVPEILNIWAAELVKLTPVWFAPLIVTALFDGVKAMPARDGVTV